VIESDRPLIAIHERAVVTMFCRSVIKSVLFARLCDVSWPSLQLFFAMIQQIICTQRSCSFIRIVVVMAVVLLVWGGMINKQNMGTSTLLFLAICTVTLDPNKFVPFSALTAEKADRSNS
jgi:hypothetical protein